MHVAIETCMMRLTLSFFLCSRCFIEGGPPLDYLDWTMLYQLGVNAVESAAMFGATASALEFLMEKKIIGRLPA